MYEYELGFLGLDVRCKLLLFNGNTVFISLKPVFKKVLQLTETDKMCRNNKIKSESYFACGW